MNDATCTVFIDLINLTVRIMPIFICLKPKSTSRENIAAISAYLWVVMIFIQTLIYPMIKRVYIIQGIFSCLFFLILLVFFEGRLSKKAFLYLSAWLFAILTPSFNEVIVWMLRYYPHINRLQITVIISSITACLFALAVFFWMKRVVNQLFDQLSRRASLLMCVYPGVFLILAGTGNHTIFRPDTFSEKGLEYILFFFLLCMMILILYVMILYSTLEITSLRKTEAELLFARQMLSKQREHYNQTLDYIEQVRIIKHDFRHHIHALLNMDRSEQMKYLLNLQSEFDRTEAQVFCQNQAVNGILQEYASKTAQKHIHFSAQMDLSAHIPIDDLTLCIVIGNLLENAIEACSRMPEPGFINIRARWQDDHLMMLIENSYNGRINQKNGRILSSKKDGGLGLISIRRILSHPGDELEVDYNEEVFTVMIKIMDRTLLT